MSAELCAADGERARPLKVRLEFGELVCDREGVALAVGVEVRELRAVALPGRG